MNKFIKKNFFSFTFLAVILIAAFLRFYQLGSNPPSLNWDETSIGYNAYSILKTGADEYGTKFPISIKSFGDYKPPLYAYVTAPSVYFFGLNEFSVRLPSAILGFLSILVMYFLVLEILKEWDEKNRKTIALISAFFIAISPWHLQFSRAAYEGNIGLFFFMLGLLLFLKGLNNSKILIFSSISFLLSIYSYHSFRLLVPLTVIMMAIFFWKEFVKKRTVLFVSISVLVLFSIPVYMSFVKAQGASSRFSMVTIFEDPNLVRPSIKRIEYDKAQNDRIGSFFHNRRLVYLLAGAKGYLDHFNPDFLFLHGDGGVQHHAVDMGMLYLWDLPFLFLGMYVLFKNRSKRINFLLFLFLIAPLPSAISTGAPQPVRAIAMVFPLHIFSAIGIFSSTAYFLTSKNKAFKLSAIFLVFVLFVLNVSYYLHQYYVHTPVEYGYFWQYGNKEAIEYAKQHENEYKKIVMTYKIDQPYVYYLFYNQIDPTWYQKTWAKKGDLGRFERKIGKYEFRYIDFNKDSKEKDSLLIGIPDEIPQSAKIIKEIRYLDGSVAYRIVKT
ncbi:glycosyltransferase family 39 protein [Patescibacteria group bacterium]|nr:glycosyltransferase family 39 protein [Patescibacteria group bacterium]